MCYTTVLYNYISLKLQDVCAFSTLQELKYFTERTIALCIHNAPNWKIIKDGKEFQYILIHTGNTDDHTMGCLLLNFSADAASFSGANSGGAYKEFYPIVANALGNGEEVEIIYTDIEPGK